MPKQDRRYLFVLSRREALLTSSLLIALIAFLDWKIEPNISLGFYYLFPLLIAAGYLRRWQILLLATACAGLREVFGPFPWNADGVARVVMVFIAFAGCGFFVREVVQKRRQAANHIIKLERQIYLRREAQRQLQLLVESSGAAILSVNVNGSVGMANAAAHELFNCPFGSLHGQSIEVYIPALAQMIKTAPVTDRFRSTTDVMGKRHTGETFLANIWVSSYHTASGPILAAIVVDASERLRDQEQSGLNRLIASSRIVVGAVAHEVQNFCIAIDTMRANLERYAVPEQKQELKALRTLIQGLRSIASADLPSRSDTHLCVVDLPQLLREVQIISQPALTQVEAEVCWDVPEEIPPVRADRHGLLQVFLNLIQNGARAVAQAETRKITVSVTCNQPRVRVCFHNSGPGIANPGRLFEPFQKESLGSGLGLYVSRSIIRSFCGDLRHEPADSGCCFAVELEPTATKSANEDYVTTLGPKSDPPVSDRRPYPVQGSASTVATI